MITDCSENRIKCDICKSGYLCEDLADKKKALRTLIKEKKASLSIERIEAASRDLTAMFLAHPLYSDCRTLFAYMSYNQEVRTAGIIKAALESGRTVAIPKIKDGRMDFYRISSPDDVEPGFCGIPEPRDTSSPVRDDDALILAPGLAFDREGRRLGYGGGFYDRFLIRRPHPTVALCYGFQLVDRVPAGECDVPVDFVLSADV